MPQRKRPTTKGVRLTKDEAKAKFEKLREEGKKLQKDFIVVLNAGLSPDSLVYKAVEREIHRVSDEQIAARQSAYALTPRGEHPSGGSWNPYRGVAPERYSSCSN